MDGAVGNRGHEIRRWSGRGRTGARMCGWQGCLSGEGTGVGERYEKDKITMSLFNDFTILAIFVSCLGLYGLVALIAVQRTKEIGIRKVLGATLSQLLSLLAKDFMKLVLWALVIALPIAGYFMSKWLASYAYHIPLTWWMFLIPILFVVMIALTVISREIVRAALANPVKSLRTE